MSQTATAGPAAGPAAGRMRWGAAVWAGIIGGAVGKALLAGAAFGLLAIYLWNFHLVAPLLFPWFTQAQNWVSVVAHVLFGMVVAGSYVVLRDRHA